MTAPVVLVSFNRPELTRRTLARIRQAAPDQLFLLADGPRAGHPGDIEKCAAVRAELDAIDWPCVVHRRFGEVNVGCEATVELGLDWVFEHVTEAIILEDDCLPDPSFFDFCNELLEGFHNDPRIVQIAGFIPCLSPELFENHSYAFTAWAPIWGWATWKRAWQTHRAEFPRNHRMAGLSPERDLPIRVNPIHWRDSLVLTPGGRRLFRDASKSMKRNNFGWDTHWSVSGIGSKSLAITPAVNMIENIGVGPDATNTRSPRSMPPALAMTFPLNHPEDVALNKDVELALEHHIVWTGGRLARFFTRHTPQGPLRNVARAIASSVPDHRSKVRVTLKSRSSNEQ